MRDFVQTDSLIIQSLLAVAISFTFMGLEQITWLEAGEQAPQSATALVGEMKVLVPMAGLIDVEAELARLDKEIGKAEGDLKRVQGKLSNPKFVDNAPEDVVNKERAKADVLHRATPRTGGPGLAVRAAPNQSVYTRAASRP